jgi:hypothetical protein
MSGSPVWHRPTPQREEPVVVNQATLHQIADEEAHRRLGESPEALRAFRRDPRASANSVRPATTVGVGDAFS